MKSFNGLRISTLSTLAIMVPISSVMAATSPLASFPIAAVEETTPRSLDGTDMMCDDNHSEFKFTFFTDQNSEEDNSWALSNAFTNEVMDVGSSYSGNTTNTFEKCLPNCGAFKFTMFDKGGDGLDAGSSARYKLQINGERIYRGGDEPFERIITDFSLDHAICPAPSFRLVHKLPNGEKLCMQPHRGDDDAEIVFKTCVDSRLKQRWTTNAYGHLMNTFHENNKCATRTKSTLQLMDCPDGINDEASFMINNEAGFINNDVYPTVYLMDSIEGMKALRYNARDETVRIRDHSDPEKERGAEKFDLHIEHVWDGPSDSFPMFYMN